MWMWQICSRPVDVCCSVLQRVAACCSVLQCVKNATTWTGKLRCVAVCLYG